MTDIDDDETERTEKSVGEEEKRREGRGLDQAKVEESDYSKLNPSKCSVRGERKCHGQSVAQGVRKHA